MSADKEFSEEGEIKPESAYTTDRDHSQNQKKFPEIIKISELDESSPVIEETCSKAGVANREALKIHLADLLSPSSNSEFTLKKSRIHSNNTISH